MPLPFSRLFRTFTSTKRRPRKGYGPVESCELRVLPANVLGTWELHLIPPQTPPEGDSGTYLLTLQTNTSLKVSGHAKKPQVFGIIDIPGIGGAALSKIKLKNNTFDAPDVTNHSDLKNSPHKGKQTDPGFTAKVKSGDVSAKIRGILSKFGGQDPEQIRVDIIMLSPLQQDFHLDGGRAH